MNEITCTAGLKMYTIHYLDEYQKYGFTSKSKMMSSALAMLQSMKQKTGAASLVAHEEYSIYLENLVEKKLKSQTIDYKPVIKAFLTMLQDPQVLAGIYNFGEASRGGQDPAELEPDPDDLEDLTPSWKDYVDNLRTAAGLPPIDPDNFGFDD
jgi:hypothetical protein